MFINTAYIEGLAEISLLVIATDIPGNKIANALYIRFSSEKISNSDEIAKGIIINYGKNQKMVGVEVLNFTERKLNLNDLVQMNSEELIPRLAQCQ